MILVLISRRRRDTVQYTYIRICTVEYHRSLEVDELYSTIEKYLILSVKNTVYES